MHQGDEIHTNVDQFALPKSGVHLSYSSSVNPNLCEPVQCYLEFLTTKDSLVCHVPFWKRPFRRQITESSNTRINQEIPLLRAVTYPVADAD